MILLKNVKENISYDAVHIHKIDIDDFFSRLAAPGSGSLPDVVIEFEDRGGVECKCIINETNCDNYVLCFNSRTYTYHDILKTPELIESVLEFDRTLYSIEELP
jgi:hypothetical protein